MTETAYIVETPDLDSQLRALKTGDTLTLPAGRVVRVRATEFVLHAANNHERARWGTREEIAGDVRHFLTTGVLPSRQHNDGCATIIASVGKYDEARANARLIAAAPELLAACKSIAAMAVSWQPLSNGDISDVLKAIAKAEGR